MGMFKMTKNGRLKEDLGAFAKIKSYFSKGF